MNFKGALIKGMSIGFFLAVLSCLLIYLSPTQADPFYTIGSFLASSPILLLLPSDLPDFLSWAVIFTYWIIAGAVTGWLAGRPRRLARISGTVLIIGIVLAHGITMRKIMEKLGEALAQGIGRMFQTNVSTE